MIIPIRKKFEFFHLAPKNNDILLNGMRTLEWYYQNDLKQYMIVSIKYRRRLIYDWKIYPNIKDPKELTLKQIHDGINIYRESENGNNKIYFFKFLPYRDLGSNISKLLDKKEAFKIDINDPITKQYILDIDWNFYNSNSKNRKLDRYYYENINEEEYFSKYNDNDPLIFSTLNHIAIIPKNNFLPPNVIEKIEIE